MHSSVCVMQLLRADAYKHLCAQLPRAGACSVCAHNCQELSPVDTSQWKMRSVVHAIAESGCMQVYVCAITECWCMQAYVRTIA